MSQSHRCRFKTGKSKLFVYRSRYAGTNEATAVTFVTEQVEELSGSS